MPNPYKARVDARRFLNLLGFHGGAYVLAYVEDTSERYVGAGARYNAEPRIILEIADCSNRINLELDVDSDIRVENSLYKIDTLIEALTQLRAGVVAEAELYRERRARIAANAERDVAPAPAPNEEQPRRRRRRARRGVTHRRGARWNR